jgi:hypothetical protein
MEETLDRSISSRIKGVRQLIYELRSYKCIMGKVPLCVKQIERALPIWERVGIRVIGVWTVSVGECNQVVYYLLGFESQDDRTAKWAAFANDPEWPEQAKTMAAEGDVIVSISNSILLPTALSPMQ